MWILTQLLVSVKVREMTAGVSWDALCAVRKLETESIHRILPLSMCNRTRSLSFFKLTYSIERFRSSILAFGGGFLAMLQAL